jgi:EmrB/QacA subfamily drug resistance transporter
MATGEAAVAVPAVRDHYGRTVGVLTLVAASAAVQQMALTPALPTIQDELGLSTTAVAWLLTVFMLSAAVVTPILGRLGDIFGKNRVLVIVCVSVALGSIVGGLATSLPMLIVARILQGVGGAVFAVAFGILRDEAPPHRRATGFGVVSSAYGVGGGVGFVLSGFVVDALSYRWLFWLSFVLFAIAAFAVHRFIAESPIKTPAAIDWVGAGLLTVGLVAVLVGVTESAYLGWTSALVLELLGAGVCVLLVWAVWEVRRREPLVDLQLLRIRGVWTVNAASAFIGFGMYVLFFLVPQFVQTDAAAGYGFGASVTEAGMFLMPWTLLMMVAAALAGPLAGRFGSRALLLAGSSSAAVAFASLALAHSEPWHVLFGTALLGVAIGLSHSSMANLVVRVVPHAQVGEAMGVMSVGRTVGSALGAQTAATVIASTAVAGSVIPQEHGYTFAFLLAAAVLALAFACVAGAPSDRPDGRRARV